MRKYNKFTPYAKINGFINNFKRKDNISGVTGVCFDNTINRWVARLNYNHKFYWGGKHKTKTMAIRSRLKLEFDLFGVEKMPQVNLIPKYIKDPENEILIAYNEFKKMEEKNEI